MAARKDYKAKLVHFSPEDWETVCLKARYLRLRTGPYIRRMAVSGEIIYYDFEQIEKFCTALGSIGVNINQIAKVVNSTQSVYRKDIEDLQREFKKLNAAFEAYLHDIDPQIFLHR